MVNDKILMIQFDINKLYQNQQEISKTLKFKKNIKTKYNDIVNKFKTTKDLNTENYQKHCNSIIQLQNECNNERDTLSKINSKLDKLNKDLQLNSKLIVISKQESNELIDKQVSLIMKQCNIVKLQKSSNMRLTLIENQIEKHEYECNFIKELNNENGNQKHYLELKIINIEKLIIELIRKQTENAIEIFLLKHILKTTI